MATPFIKYVGGKRQLLEEIRKRMPQQFNNYYEPFVGGGAVFLDIAAGHKSFINDFNTCLINIYRQIKFNPIPLKSELDKLQNSFNSMKSDEERKKFYYESRGIYNQMLDNEEMSPASAAMMVFLNKTSFNGLYRVNKAGHFNVPFNQKKKVNLYDSDNLNEISYLLQDTIITTGDFEKVCNSAKSGDFVFFDSPYYDTFDTYQAGGFTEEDHRRLADLYKRLTERGVYCMLTNSNTDFIKELYSDYKVEVIPVKRMVNRDASNRVGEEVIVINY